MKRKPGLREQLSVARGRLSEARYERANDIERLTQELFRQFTIASETLQEKFTAGLNEGWNKGRTAAIDGDRFVQLVSVQAGHASILHALDGHGQVWRWDYMAEVWRPFT